MNKVLVLGNDPFINEIQFDRLDPGVTTLGVNRIWLKHFPDFFFFNDIHILQELQKSEALPKLKEKSTCFSSDWLVKKNKSLEVPEWISVWNRVNRVKFPDSVTTGIHLFSKHYKQSINTTYYIAGVSLKWKERSHFWKEMEYQSLNTYGEAWYSPRFAMILQNFKSLKALGFKMVSVTPDSQLNKVLRYENIENLYRT